MTFKAKLFKLGNSKGIYIPKKVYTEMEDGKEYEWQVYTKEAEPAEKPAKVYTKPQVITPENKHRWIFDTKTGTYKTK